ncbi:hypothetical protein L9F63_009841 [Diploptera punctata]|uniref:Uncharacterized protein n=1 Tax=Diploptera punctata TaxID=6984 RepID=A0AAD8ERY8_DIPPU|nr:hypothetical protein L9F63_009841 [Diploptera punctata]
MINVIIVRIKINVENGDFEELKIYSYNPFINEVTALDMPRSMNKSDYGFHLFESKFRNLHGYSLRISMYDHNPKAILDMEENRTVVNVRGEDGEILKTLAKLMNFSMIINIPKGSNDINFRRPNGNNLTGTEKSEELVYNRSDVCFISKFMRYTYKGRIDYTYPHDKQGFCVIVPKSHMIPQFLRIILPFKPILWAFTILMILTVSIFWYITKRMLIYRSSFVRVLLKVLSILEKHGKLLFFFLMYSSMVLVTMYQSSLISSLVIPYYYKDINTLEDLDKQGLKLVMYPGMKESAVLNTKNPVRISLAKKIITKTNRLEDCLDILVSNNDVACACNELQAKVTVKRRKYFRNGMPLLHVMKHCLTFYAETYEIRRNSPFLPRFNTLIKRIMESGLLYKWRKDELYNSTLEEQHWLKTTDMATVLKLSHVQAAFYILIMGLSVSSLVFFKEIELFSVSHKCRKYLAFKRRINV